MNKRTFVKPCYNCKSYIIDSYNKLRNEIKKFKVKYKIIFVDDGSIDKTFDILNYLKKK